MQRDGDTSANTPHNLTNAPSSPPPDKEHYHQAPSLSSYAASDTYTEDEFVVIEWEEDEAERAIDLTNSADLSSSAADLSTSTTSDLSSSATSSAQQSWHGAPHDKNLSDHMKRDWYQVWLRDKTVEKSDPWGFSSTGASRTASPSRNGATA